MTPVIAVFDLDCTLTRRDTLLPWLVEMRGWRRTLTAAARAGVINPANRATGAGDLRTRIKERLLKHLLTGVPVEAAHEAALAVGRRIGWRTEIVRALEEHRAAGHRVLIATGSSSLFASAMLADRFGLLDVIGTELEVADGHLTGRLAGANCVRLAKADRVADWLRRNGPFAERWGYGNTPHDLPMLDLMDYRKIV